MEFLKHQLDNGLQVVAERNPNAYSMAIGYFVRTGSRDETDELAGVSHFLEHMVFKGTQRRSAADVNRELDAIGSESNAYTNEEQTVYYASFLPEYQDRAADLLSDIMRPALRESDFEMEKKVILEEIAKYEDQPPFGANEKVMAAHFGDHPLSRSVLGSTESVSALTAEQMRDYFATRYSPGNMALVATGNVDFDGLVRSAEQFCGDWERAVAPRSTPPASARQGVHFLKKEMAVQQYGLLVSSGPASEDDARYTARMLATVVGDGSGSRFYWDLVETGRAEYAEMSPYDFQGAGVMITFPGCAPDASADVWRSAHEILAEVQQTGVTSQELEQA
ncbi:MAG: pitrilysin family protein, partial [Pirellulaceae bacterium]|nr:pitrilysin family protein [Pirellulaceae bacterium]